ncbi:MAG: hypothetical protein ACREOZ_00420, partial [Gloeomargaritales cyanobacterium]
EYNYPGGPSRFLADFQQCILDLETAKQKPLDDSEKKSKFCLAIKDRDYFGVRGIIVNSSSVDYGEAITMVENQIMMLSPTRLSSRQLHNASSRGGYGRGGRENSRGRGRGRG